MDALARRLAPLRVRIALLVAGASVAALLVMYAMVVPSLERNLQRSHLGTLTETVSKHVTPDELASLSAGSEGTLRGLGQDMDVQRVTLYRLDPSGKLQPIADSLSLNRKPPPPDVAREAALGADYSLHGAVDTFAGRIHAVVAVPFPYGGRNVAVFADPLTDVHASVALVQRRILIGGAIAFGLAVLIGLAAAEALARRLRRLRDAADRISRGRFDQPIVDTEPDEVGDLARSFDAMRAKLERLDRARNEFIANASHELRTPITSLGGFLELVSEEDLDPETRARFLDEMRDQLDRLARLASDLLDLSRLDAGGVRVSRDEIDLGSLAGVAARELAARAERDGSQLELAASEPAYALGDEGRVLQVTRALIDNALRHTPAGTAVRVEAGRDDRGRPYIAVSDDGPGISRETQDHVFERFWRGPGAAAQGSGLGLAIAAELAARMGGSLTVASQPGETTFRLTLVPSRAAARQPAPAGRG